MRMRMGGRQGWGRQGGDGEGEGEMEQDEDEEYETLWGHVWGI
jgi:hypothetical protein